MAPRRKRRPTFSNSFNPTSGSDHQAASHLLGGNDSSYSASDSDGSGDLNVLDHRNSVGANDPLLRMAANTSGRRGSSGLSRSNNNNNNNNGTPAVDVRRRRNTHTRSSQQAPSSTFVERWLRKGSSSGAQRPSFANADPDDDAFVGIPMGAGGDANTSHQHAIVDDDSASLKSKPSTRRSSMDSSIDDVCMPLDNPDDERFPYDGIDHGAPHGRSRAWPDLHVLDDFANREKEELEHTEAADLVRQGLRYSAPSANDRVAVNEAEAGGRLRPPHPVPWMKQTAGLNASGLEAGGQRVAPNFRFTYFRDDLPATIHSPTISGLLQPGQSFGDLFPSPPGSRESTPSESRAPSARPTTRTPSVAPQAQTAAENRDHGSRTGTPPTPHHHAAGTPVAASSTHHSSHVSTDTLVTPGQTADDTATVITPGNAVAIPSDATQGGRYAHSTHGSHGADAHHYHHAHKSSDLDGSTGTPVQSSIQLEGLEPARPTSSVEPPPSTSDAGPSPFWLDILCPTEEEMRVLSKVFGIHPLTAEDIILEETREKVELFHNYYFVCFTAIDVSAMRKSRSSQTAALAAAAAEAGNDPGAATSGTRRRRDSVSGRSMSSRDQSRQGKKGRRDRLRPLAVYTIVFHTGVITIHYKPTPHTINVRRRIRLLRDYLNISSDWISYALIDDITDGFGPLINSIEEDVNSIEDAILRMHDSDDSSDESDDDDQAETKSMRSRKSYDRRSDAASSSTSESGSAYREWRRKGDMLRWIGESRKRVMGVLSLLSNKADVIKGFSKRVTDQWSGAPRTDIALYLSDIQDHLVTMVQSLNHYEKLLARSHSNYLAQINIDMTKANNDMNDVLGKISVLGTIVLPMNIVTGLWGMNVLVPGQGVDDSLRWFWGIIVMMITISVSAYWAISRYL